MRIREVSYWIPRHEAGNCEVNACYREERDNCVDRTLQNVASTNPNQVAQPDGKKIRGLRKNLSTPSALRSLGARFSGRFAAPLLRHDCGCDHQDYDNYTADSIHCVVAAWCSGRCRGARRGDSLGA